MYALRYIAVVMLLIVLFGPGMAVLFDPWVALLVALICVALAAQLADTEEGPED
jgi:purine-cytosine permease-like protein